MSSSVILDEEAGLCLLALVPVRLPSSSLATMSSDEVLSLNLLALRASVGNMSSDAVVVGLGSVIVSLGKMSCDTAGVVVLCCLRLGLRY